jgi:hypothetical protein
MNRNRYIDAINRGRAWLDEYVPDWRNVIALDALDIAHCQRCVLGQVLGSYNSVKVEALQGPVEAWSFDNWAADHGFMLFEDDRTGDMQAKCNMLSQMWRESLTMGVT